MAADIVVTAAKVGVVWPEKAEIIPQIAGATITAGQALYIIAASGKVGLADEDAAESSQFVGIALNGAAAGQAVDVLRRGAVYGFTLTAIDYGAALWVSATAGALYDSQVTAGNIAGRVIALSDADLTKVLYVDATTLAAS